MPSTTVHFARIGEITNADGHAGMAAARLVAIGAEQAVPPAQVEAEVGIGLVVLDGMMHAVHVGRDDDPAQYAIERGRQADVAVIEHGRGIEQYLEDHHRDHRRAEHHDGGKLDQHGQDDLDGMETRTRRHVIVEVGMVYAMQPPQRRNGMDHDMLQPDHEVHGDHRQRRRDPERRLEMVEQAPAVFRAEGCQPDRRQGEKQANDHGIEHDQTDIAGPSVGFRYEQRPPGREHLPERDRSERAKEEAEPYGGLVRKHELLEIHGASSPCKGKFNAAFFFSFLPAGHARAIRPRPPRSGWPGIPFC